MIVENDLSESHREDRPIRTAVARPLVCLLVAALVSCGAAASWLWEWRMPSLLSLVPERSELQAGTSLAGKANALVDSFAISAAVLQKPPYRIRVAVFKAERGGTASLASLATLLDSDAAWTWECVDAPAIRAGALSRFDTIVFPGGSGSKQALTLGNEGKRAVREFVRSGGGCVGICAGAFLTTANYKWSLALVNAKTLTGKKVMPGVGMVPMAARGSGIVKMELTEAGRRILGDVRGPLRVRYSSGPIFAPAGRHELPEYVCLARFRSEIWEYECQRGTMIDTPAIVAARFGKGRVMAISPHPEATKGLEAIVRRAILSTARRHAETIARDARRGVRTDPE